MIRAFRIVSTKNLKDSVLITLARDGIEDPKSNAVVLDDDDLPAGTKNVNCEFEGKKRPKVMVNGVEMFLKSYSDKPKYSVNSEDLVAGMVTWSMCAGMNPRSVASALKQYSVCREPDNELVIEVAWE